jgi:hypothetical protein
MKQYARYCANMVYKHLDIAYVGCTNPFDYMRAMFNTESVNFIEKVPRTGYAVHPEVAVSMSSFYIQPPKHRKLADDEIPLLDDYDGNVVNINNCPCCDDDYDDTTDGSGEYETFKTMVVEDENPDDAEEGLACVKRNPVQHTAPSVTPNTSDMTSVSDDSATDTETNGKKLRMRAKKRDRYRAKSHAQGKACNTSTCSSQDTNAHY